MLTSYGNIATAVSSVKLGADDYLPKPANIDDIEKSLNIIQALYPLHLKIQCQPIE